jgi:hypothetical protein
MSLDNFARVLHDRGDPARSRPLYEHVLAICEKTFGHEHPYTNRVRRNLALLLVTAGSAAETLTFGETALAGHEKVLGKNHRWTKDSAGTTADALAALGRADDALVLRNSYSLEPDAPPTG